jgi:hypothetical protein
MQRSKTEGTDKRGRGRREKDVPEMTPKGGGRKEGGGREGGGRKEEGGRRREKEGGRREEEESAIPPTFKQTMLLDQKGQLQLPSFEKKQKCHHCEPFQNY